MPRARFKLTVQPAVKADWEKRFKTTDDVRQRQRLQAVLLATTGQHGYRDIARIVGCATSTFALWLNQFLAGGIAGLLRRESPPGLSSPIAEPKVQQQLKDGLKAGRWRTAEQVAAWLWEAHGIKRAAKSLYRWLGKAGGERADVVRAAIAKLPEDLRTVILLFEYEAQSQSEIAAVLHCTPKAVEMRLYRARQALRESLAAWL